MAGDTLILFSTKDVFLFGVTMPLLLALMAFVRYTRLGKAIRAVAQDREAAAMMGVSVERIIATAFFIGGALAGAAGMVVGLYLNTGRYLMGFDVGLKAFTAAVVGGIGNIPGALLGGYTLGFLSAFSDQYLSSAWTRATVFGILILVLVFRPWGFLGQPPPEKVLMRGAWASPAAAPPTGVGLGSGRGRPAPLPVVWICSSTCNSSTPSPMRRYMSILALGLNIVVGYAGLLDLGYAAFFAIGAYTTGILTWPPPRHRAQLLVGHVA